MKNFYFKKQLLFVAFFTLVYSFSYSQAPSYYDGTDITQTGEQLKNNLSVLISTGTIELSYTPGVWNALKQTDLDSTNPNNVLLIYGYDDTDGNYVTDRTRSKDLNGGTAGTNWNREHTYPKSLGNPNLGTAGPGADAHHLRPSDVTFNNNRGSFPYADADGNARVISNSWYPGDEWKGDVARMMMYMYLRYGDRCLPTVVGTGNTTYSADIPDIFLEWNAEDPVAQHEIVRNVLLEGIQGNRNPFIDNPAFATTIWGGPQAEDRFTGGVADTEVPSIPTNLVATNTTQTETTLSWNASTDNIGVIAYQIFNGTTLVSSTSTTTYIVTELTANTSYSYTVTALDAASNSSANSNEVTITTLEDITPPITDNALILTGIYDGPLPGGIPKGVEIYVTEDIADLSVYGLGSANNGDGTDGEEFTFPVEAATAGSFIYVAMETLEFTNFFGFAPNYTSGAMAINGDDAVELYQGGAVVDIFGDINVDGNGQPWEYLDGWAYRNENTGPDGSTFVLGSWSFSGPNALDGALTNTTTTTPFPIGSYTVAGPAEIVINEVDADQTSTDATEFIELYDGGVGNSSLDGLVVVLFNGSDDASYDAIDLDGYSTNAAGYFVIGSAGVTNVDLAVFTTNGIQNGADAVALIVGDATDFPNDTPIVIDENLLDAFVYDTNDGDDTGLLPLLNTGQAQINEDGAGNKDNHSSQRIPNGTGGLRNTSTYSQLAPTPGVENIAGVLDTEAPSTPLNIVASNITQSETTLTWEASTDNVAVAEYQIFSGTTQVGSTTDSTITLTGLTPSTDYSFTVVALDAANNVSGASVAVDVTTLVGNGPASALILTGIYDGPLPGGIPKGVEIYVTEDITDLSVYGLGSANNGGGSDGEEFTFPAEAATAGSFIYVAMETTGFTSFFGFAPNYTSGAMAINGDDAVELFQGGVVVDTFGDLNADGNGEPWEYLDGWAYRNENTGLDGSTFVLASWSFSGPNALDGASTNATATTPFPIGSYTVAGPAEIVINEVDADQTGTDATEFIELYDGGVGNSSLDGLVIVLFNGSDDASYNAIDLDGLSTNAAGYFVIGSADVPNVDLAAFTTNGIQNGADAVALIVGDATDYPNDTPIVINENLLDAFVYDTNDGDDAGLSPLLNAGEAQINEGELGNKDGHSNQRIPNGQGGARNTATYTQANPSPGTENGAIIPPPAPITILEARNSADGDLVTVSGVLTVSDQFSGSAYIQDTTGGIAIFDEQVHGDGNFMIGDSITVSGTRSAFNEQIQIGSVTVVENNGVPNQAIEPLIITLSELVNHPGELVRIVGPNFPRPGDILFGNANYTLNDSSGSGALRIDNDVEAIVGLGQPETCNEITGVVGRFFETYQLLPRQASDMACASAYVPIGSDIDVSKGKTLDVVTWNIEWFGDEANSPAAGNPMSDSIQKDSAKTVITQLNADVYAVQEIADDVLFAQMVSELPGYDYVLSPAVSRPDDLTGVKQKVGFIYNTATITNVNTKVLLESIHPLYNGGDDSALVNYPSTTDRFYASGRLPLLMTADVVINGETEQYNFVALHARANSSNGPQNRYDMRKYDVEVLKDSLDVQYATSNLIVLGDFNDDVDVTVADVTTTVSTYEEYILDTDNYNIVSSALSAGGFRSFVSRDNMIDHILVSDEVSINYIDGSVSVGYEFYDSDYSRTASDHFPVSARFQLNELELTNSSFTNVDCNGDSSGGATVTVSGGITPYTYDWSDGVSTTAIAENLSAGTYLVTVTDALGSSVSQEFAIIEPETLILTTTEDATVYFGYEPLASTTMAITAVTGGTASYSYEWSTGETTATIDVSPEETTVYTIIVTDANGCAIATDITIEVIDVRCGNNLNNPKVEICHKGKTICVSENAVQSHLNHGDVLGSCEGDAAFISSLKVYPNPFNQFLDIELNSNDASNAVIGVYSIQGNLVFQTQEQLSEGNTKLNYSLQNLQDGIYFLKVFVDGELKKVTTLVKR